MPYTTTKEELTALQILTAFFSRFASECSGGRLHFSADQAQQAYRDILNELTTHGHPVSTEDRLEASGKYFSVERALSRLVSDRILFPVDEDGVQYMEFKRGAFGRLERLWNAFDLSPDVERALLEATEATFQIHAEAFLEERTEV